jgi:CRP/FNR family transcriptional regulator, cyclic AMP receptor protein
MITKPALLSTLAATPLFQVLDATDLALVADRMRPVEFGNGQMIFSRGDNGRDIYLVLSGRVRLSILTVEGRELSLAHATAGQVFGEIAALDGKSRTADATAISAVQAMILPQSALVGLMESHPRVAAAFIKFLCARLRETDDKLEAIALHPIETRLARLLLSALALQSPGQAGERVPLTLGMSQSELALLIGASRPKVNTALMVLEDQGAFSRDGARMLCNTDVLADIAAVD